jgi:peptidoglycan hydrolase-like amidase
MFVLALLLHVQVLGLLHPQKARVWPDGAAQPIEVQPGQTYGVRGFSIEVQSPPHSIRRDYRGRLRVEDQGAGLRLINEVELEEYVASVVGAEIDAGPAAAREALAVVARTFAVRAEAAGHLCDTTHCQWYRGSKGADIESARRTQGEILLLQDGRTAPAFHSQDCGGQTARARDVWAGAGKDEEQASQRAPDTHLPGLPKGSGHGVGLCQRGAIFLATKGASGHRILARYFPRLHIGRLSLAF